VIFVQNTEKDRLFVQSNKRPNYDCWNCQAKLTEGASGGFCSKPCRDEFFKTIFALEIGQSKAKLDEALSHLEDVLYQEHGSQRERGGAHIIYCAGLSSNERACSFLVKMGKFKEIDGQTYELVKEPEAK